MDFSKVELTEDEKAFQAEVREFLDTYVTDEVRKHDRDTGDNFDIGVHRALAEKGWLEKEIKGAEGWEGGFTRVESRIWHLERRRAEFPWVTWGTTVLIAHSVAAFAKPELREEVLQGVYDGDVRMCLGYTEPEGGSDVATCKTRAVRDGDDWVINGSKMFTTGAHNCQYCFLITNTDPDARKHKSLTMFLVPLDTPGVEIQPLWTVDGDRTNIVYYSDVRISDKYRLGEINEGWTVVREPLNKEHGVVDAVIDGLDDVSILQHQGMYIAKAADAVVAETAEEGPDGTRRIDDPLVSVRLGQSLAKVEAALASPHMFGRVALAQAMRDVSPVLMDIAGPTSVLPIDEPGADLSRAEYVYRWSPLTGIYGGTLEVFRNMIAQYILGLGKPVYAAPKAPTAS